MSKWHVWGDFLHTKPHRIGEYHLISEGGSALTAAKREGFDFDKRTRNGFEPWAATFAGDGGDEFAFASSPTVRGWCKA